MDRAVTASQIASDAMVTMRDVSFAYAGATPVIRALDLDVARGEIMAILGPNGSGKTTLLKLLTGAITADTGTVRVRAPIGFVPQLTTTTFAYSVLDTVLMGRARSVGTFSVPSARDDALALAALDRVQMGGLVSRAVDTLSGGERQLVMFARALASDARLLVLDEPMASLDLGHQRLVLQTMQRLVRDDGLTAVFTTHQPEHAIAIADSAALVSRTAPIQVGSADELLTIHHLAKLFDVPMRRARVEESPAHSDATAHVQRDILIPDWGL